MQTSQVHPHQTLSSMSLWTCFVHWFRVMLEQEGVIPNISWYAKAFRVPFTGTKGSSPAPEKQPHTIIPPPLNVTLGTKQSNKYRSLGSHQTQTRLSDCQIEKRDSSLQRTRLHCSRVQWQRSLHHCFRHFALHLLMHGLDAAARPQKPIDEAIYTLFLS